MTLPQPSAFSAILRGGTPSARAAGDGLPTQADSVDPTDVRVRNDQAPRTSRTDQPGPGRLMMTDRLRWAGACGWVRCSAWFGATASAHLVQGQVILCLKF
jgi:hypothetical protein